MGRVAAAAISECDGGGGGGEETCTGEQHLTCLMSASAFTCTRGGGEEVEEKERWICKPFSPTDICTVGEGLTLLAEEGGDIVVLMGSFL